MTVSSRRMRHAFRSGRPSALHRGRRDPQHHQRRAAASSGAGVGQCADQGTGTGARRRVAGARPPRRRADAGRGKPARSCTDRDPPCRGAAAAISLAFSRGVKATCAFSPTRRAYRNICRRRWPPSSASIPHISIDVEERESGDIAHAILTGAADLGLAAEHALPDTIERIPFSEDRLVLVAARADELAGRRQVDFSEVVERDFVGLITSSALHAHVTGHAARLGARLRFRARLNNFDAIGEMVAAGIGVAVMPEVAAKRCARAMKINVVRIRDSWANRRLAICARSFKSLPRPAKQLADHLRTTAP